MRIWFIVRALFCVLGVVAAVPWPIAQRAEAVTKPDTFWEGARPRSYREMRYDGVVAQTDWSTCGPAVLATYATYYLGQETSEADMIRLILGGGEAAWPDALPNAFGTSMLQLRDALGDMGVPSVGYRVDVAELTAYFERGGPPLVLHVTRPAAHYVLAVGMVDAGHRRLLFVADPSYGRRLIAPEELKPAFGFSGYVLVPVPPEPLLSQVRERQRHELARESLRVRRLSVVASAVAGETSPPAPAIATDDPNGSSAAPAAIDPVRLPEEKRGDLLVALGLDAAPGGREGLVFIGDGAVGFAEVSAPVTARLSVRYAVARGLSVSVATEAGWAHHRLSWQGGDESRSTTWKRPDIAGVGLHYQTRRSPAGHAAGFDLRMTPGTAQVEASVSQVRDPLVLFGSVFYQADRDRPRRRALGLGTGVAFVANERITLRGSLVLSLPLSGLEIPASAASWRLSYLLDVEGEQELAVYGSWTANGQEAPAKIGIEWVARMSK